MRALLVSRLGDRRKKIKTRALLVSRLGDRRKKIKTRALLVPRLGDRSLLVCLVGFLTSSSATRLYRGRAPRQFYALPQMSQSWGTRLLSQPVTLY